MAANVVAVSNLSRSFGDTRALDDVSFHAAAGRVYGLVGANVTVDIFTEGMSERGKQAMAAFSSLFAIAFSVLLLVQMSSGFRSYLRYVEVTPVLKLPLWTAFPPILFSLLLLLCAAVITFVASWRAVRGPQAGGAEK